MGMMVSLMISLSHLYMLRILNPFPPQEEEVKMLVKPRQAYARYNPHAHMILTNKGEP